MPARLDWMDDLHTILCITYTEPLTLDDVFASLDETVQRLNGVDHTVACIADLSAVDHMVPNSICAYPRIARHPAVGHPNVGPRYVVIDSAVLCMVAGIFQEMFVRFPTVRTRQEALQRIAEAADREPMRQRPG